MRINRLIFANIRGGRIVSALVSGSSRVGSSSGRKHCVLFLGQDTLYNNSHSVPLRPGVQMGTGELSPTRGNPATD